MQLILVERIHSIFGHLEVTSPLDKPLPPPCHFVSPFGEPPPPLVGGDVLYGRSLKQLQFLQIRLVLGTCLLLIHYLVRYGTFVYYYVYLRGFFNNVN